MEVIVQQHKVFAAVFHLVILILLVNINSNNCDSYNAGAGEEIIRPRPVSASSLYVDPSDMGSYSHSLQRNIIINSNTYEHEEIVHKQDSPLCSDVQKQVIHPETSNTCSGKQSTDFDSAEKGNAVGQKEEFCTPCHEQEVSPAVMVYTERIIASILRQLNIRNRKFGPKESITIDLQAEISYEDFTKLNSFVLNSSKRGSGGPRRLKTSRQEDEIRLTTDLASVADIMGNLFSVSKPQPTVTFLEYLKENINFDYLSSTKVWINLLAASVVLFLIAHLLQRACMSTHPLRALSYGFLLFFVISCIIVFFDLYEAAQAENRARLHQYDKIPKDCNYNEFGVMDSIGYFVRIHLLSHKDQCSVYYKEMLGDKFFHISPIEAISETLAKMIFHPMEYIGDKLGRFFGGIIAEVPFWLKPILLLLIFLFGFLAIFGYRIRSPFITIEPSPTSQRTRYRLENEDRQPTPAIPQQVPPAQALPEVVPPSCVEVSTSTEDLEEYIRGETVPVKEIGQTSSQ